MISMESLGIHIEQLEHSIGQEDLWPHALESPMTMSLQRTAFARFYPEFLYFDYTLSVRQGLVVCWSITRSQSYGQKQLTIKGSQI